jgi:hypothetical protein
MTAHLRKPAAHLQRFVRRLVCLLLVAAFAPIVGPGTRASATTAAPAVMAQPGTVAPLVPSGDIEAASATLVQEVEEFNRQVAETAQQAKDVVTEAEQISKSAAADRRDAAAFNTKAAAVGQEVSGFNTRAEALSARIDAHNSKPNTFQLPAQAAAANAYEAEASELRAEQAQLQTEKSKLQTEQTQLEEEQSRISSEQARLTAATEGHNTKISALQSEEQQLESQGGQLLQRIAQAMQSLVDNPPDPAATMDQGGDAAGPPRQTDQSASQGNDAADGADSPSMQPQTSALEAYAKQTGTTVDMRPGTVYLTPEAVSQLPAALAAQLGSPSTTYDGLVRKPDGHYTALEVQTQGTTEAPGQRAFKTAVTRRGQVVAYQRGMKLIIDEFKTVPVAPNSSPALGTPSPSPSGEAACLTGKPQGAMPSGGGWILNTTERVPHRNKTTVPVDGPSGRATQATACLTELAGGTDAQGNITGWKDAQTFAALNPGSGGLARCHLIANVLGGRGIAKNLVPCWQVGTNVSLNSMREYESQIEQMLGRGLPEGEAVYYVVTPHYRDAASTIPDSITMSAVVELPDGTSWPVFYPVTRQNVAEVGGLNLGN